MSSVFLILNKHEGKALKWNQRVVCLSLFFCPSKIRNLENLEPTDWNSAIQELLEKQGVDIKSEMEKK
jgi:hypothetical protein